MLDWEVRNLKFDMLVFYISYIVFRNDIFLDFFGYLYSDMFDFEKDLIFYNDLYRFY